MSRIRPAAPDVASKKASEPVSTPAAPLLPEPPAPSVPSTSARSPWAASAPAPSDAFDGAVRAAAEPNPSSPQTTDVRDTPASAVFATAPAKINPKDWHIPTLDEVFTLAEEYPGKKIFLDSKTSNQPEIATRLAGQYVDLLRAHPTLRDRVIVGCPNAECLDAMKKVFADQPDFQGFKNFTFDNEHLNDSHSHHDLSLGDPLRGSADNAYISVGDPKTPLKKDRANFDDLLKEVKATLSRTRDPSDPNFGKKLYVWTIDDHKKMEALAKLGPAGILTDNPEALQKVLDRHYGPAGVDPNRPEVMCHRGGPDNKDFPENTLPMIQRGFEVGDSIEIDLCPSKDGTIVFHDNDPNDSVALARDAELEDTSFRPLRPDLGTALRGKRLDELTIAEVRANYGFTRKPTQDVGANVASGVLRNILRGPGTLLEVAGRLIPGKDPLELAGEGLNKAVDHVVAPVIDGATKGVDAAVNGVAGVIKEGEE